MIYKLKKKHVGFYVDRILSSGRRGKPLEVFLLEHEIRKSEWDEYVRKHEKLRLAMSDAEEYCKAYALKQVDKLIQDKFINPTIAKMYLQYTAGWKESADANSLSKDKEQESNINSEQFVAAGESAKDILLQKILKSQSKKEA